MKKTVWVLMMVLTVAMAFAGGNRDTSDPTYLEYKKQAISEIISLLESGTDNYIYISNYTSKIADLVDEKTGQKFSLKKYLNCQEDLSKALSEYSQAIDSHNKIVESKEWDEYYDLFPKYYPVQFGELEGEQKMKILRNILGDRTIFKNEWDMLVSQYHIQAGRSRSIVFKDGSSKSEVRDALNWIISQEALWTFGYKARFVSSLEYESKYMEFERTRKAIILYSEKKGLYE